VRKIGLAEGAMIDKESAQRDLLICFLKSDAEKLRPLQILGLCCLVLLAILVLICAKIQGAPQIPYLASINHVISLYELKSKPILKNATSSQLSHQGQESAGTSPGTTWTEKFGPKSIL
jgi:hypothetical protein